MPPDPSTLVLLGKYFLNKWRDRLSETPIYSLAKQMRKQGIPLNIALLVLLGCNEREPT